MIPDANTGSRSSIVANSLWGNDGGYEVFTECLSYGLRVVFRYSTYPTLPRSIQSRIVTCYYNNLAADEMETFTGGDEMCEAVWSSIARVWESCSYHPSIASPDVVVEIYEDKEGRLQWRLSHLSVYEDYLELLLPLDRVLYEEIPLDAYETFDIHELKGLIYHECFGHRGNTKLVSLHSDTDSRFAFKGLDLAKYLRAGSNFKHRRDDYYHEIRTIRSLVPHPNIIKPAATFVTAAEISDEPCQYFVCGILYPYMVNGSLNDQVNRAIKANSHLGLVEKAKWCFQMASAIAHTHHICHTYHNDIKPSNFLIDDAGNLILIGWDQSGAPPRTLAPEADSSYHVEAQSDVPNAKPLLGNFSGPEPTNAPSSRPQWNIYPIWKDECPEALEAAEVYSLGRTMWMLLEEVDEGHPEDEIVIAHWEKARDIPHGWKTIVSRCLEASPQARTTLSDLVSFWERAKNEMQIIAGLQDLLPKRRA